MLEARVTRGRSEGPCRLTGKGGAWVSVSSIKRGEGWLRGGMQMNGGRHLYIVVVGVQGRKSLRPPRRVEINCGAEKCTAADELFTPFLSFPLSLPRNGHLLTSGRSLHTPHDCNTSLNLMRMSFTCPLIEQMDRGTLSKLLLQTTHRRCGHPHNTLYSTLANFLSSRLQDRYL